MNANFARVWDRKPFMSWSWLETVEVLSESPWVALCPVGSRLVPALSEGSKTEKTVIYYRVVFLTARPVREACLRLVSFGPDYEKLNTHANAKNGDSVKVERLRLEQFTKAHPNDLRITGSSAHIILSITEVQFLHYYDADHRVVAMSDGTTRSTVVTHPDLFLNLQLSDLGKGTFLSTKSGKKAPIVQYEQPSQDNLGAKLYFPRLLPDGRPFITLNDDELLFESTIRGKTIHAKFDVKKLVFGGKLEL